MQNQDFSRSPYAHDEIKTSCKKYTIDIPFSMVSKIQALSGGFRHTDLEQRIVDLINLSLASAEQEKEVTNHPPIPYKPSAIQAIVNLNGIESSLPPSPPENRRLDSHTLDKTPNDGVMFIDDFSFGPVACARSPVPN